MGEFGREMLSEVSRRGIGTLLFPPGMEDNVNRKHEKGFSRCHNTVNKN